VLGEDVLVGGVAGQPRREVGRDELDVVADRVPLAVALDDEPGEVLVEDVADDADDEVGLGVQQRGAPPFSALVLMTSHCACRRRTSPEISSSEAPSAAVRMMTPASSGTTFFRIFFRRSRSGSGSLRLIPVIEPSGT
jgi:hypothetical protein